MARLLWWILCINLWGFAIFGAIFTVLAVLGYVTGQNFGRRLFGQTVQTPEQDFAWLIWSLAFMCLGAVWVYLQTTGRVLFKADKPGTCEEPARRESYRAQP